ncbi:DUF1330 domain-containing protein [Rhodobacteraceae bacterium Araon29]
MIQFPSFEAAHEWCHSKGYAQAKTVRMSAATSLKTIFQSKPG